MQSFALTSDFAVYESVRFKVFSVRELEIIKYSAFHFTLYGSVRNGILNLVSSKSIKHPLAFDFARCGSARIESNYLRSLDGMSFPVQIKVNLQKCNLPSGEQFPSLWNDEYFLIRFKSLLDSGRMMFQWIFSKLIFTH
ncbi:hypothetical protein CEXT_747051 [Caerostris extrusa]|uniref:Uncharacterized protein n=1 Tax=Caerostris extrusa TaxID=172846 RepID=A0AAV4P337_CAEEX|nr:hypothetical protein CEXT_747051 [Caerostris extrusa]